MQSLETRSQKPLTRRFKRAVVPAFLVFSSIAGPWIASHPSPREQFLDNNPVVRGAFDTFDKFNVNVQGTMRWNNPVNELRVIRENLGKVTEAAKIISQNRGEIPKKEIIDNALKGSFLFYGVPVLALVARRNRKKRERERNLTNK